MIWLITGTSSGFGRALVRVAERRGHSVFATARDPAAIGALASDRVAVARLDVTRPDTVAAAVRSAQQRFGGIDVLVNNAGFGLLGAFEELTPEELRESFETNLMGGLSLLRATLPTFKAQGSGVVVQMSSLVGVVPGAGGSAYVGPKAALEAMSECIAAELAPLGIHVMIVEPGAFRTEFTGRSLRTARSLPDYEATIGAAARAFAASHGSQRGDPERGAEAICAAVEMRQPPLRLILGSDAEAGIRGYLQGRLGELDRATVTATDFAG